MPAPKNKRKGKGKSKKKWRRRNISMNKHPNQSESVSAKKQSISQTSQPTQCNDDIKKCEYCSKSHILKRCSGCKKVYYCNQDCQSSHWNKHKNLCKFYRLQNKQIKNDLFIAKTFNQNNNYIKRIDFLLDVYEQFMDNNGQYDKYNDIYELISHRYPGTKIEYFISDYNNYSKYAINIDNNNIYKKYDGKCNLTLCKHIQREYRDRSIYDTNYEPLYQLYHCHSDKSIVISQFLDQLHIIKYHSGDLGLRCDFSDNQSLLDMKNMLMKKRTIFNKIRKDNIKSVSKFVTQIYGDEEQKANEHKHNSQLYSYSFGFRYYYHKYYKNNQTREGRVPGTNHTDRGNVRIRSDYTYGDWYIGPKNESIKQEVLQSKYAALTIIQYTNTLIKAQLKHSVLHKHIGGSKDAWEMVYGIKKDSPITMNHILAVLLYTNHTELSAAFSKTYRKITTTETDKSVKQRHSEYGHWAKLLREAVECWGTQLHDKNTEIKCFYHGISRKMVFDSFNPRFAGPTSTTLQYAVAVTFANQGQDENGIIIKIANNYDWNFFFNCTIWSDYPGELEMLFLGGFNPLVIEGLSVIGENKNYDKWMKALSVFVRGLMEGATYQEQITKSTAQLIDLLVDHALNKKSKNRKTVIPKYIRQLYMHLINNATGISIDLSTFEKDEFYASSGEYEVHYYGNKILSHIYFLDNKVIKWSVLRMLFPSLVSIYIHASQLTKHVLDEWDDFEFCESILIGDSILSEILSYFQKTKLKTMCIRYPSNTAQSLDAIKKQYSSAFCNIGVQLSIENQLHHELGSCNVFQFRRYKFV
eukprot:351699_1